MTIEDRVTRALTEEAESIDVDVEALRTRTRDRLAGARSWTARLRADTGSRCCWRRPVTSVAVIAAGATFLTTRIASTGPQPRPGDVDVRVAAPVTWTSRPRTSSSAALGPGGPAAVAEYDAPAGRSWRRAIRPPAARQRRRDARLRHDVARAVDGGWALVSARACGGAGGAPSRHPRDELRLRTHRTEPYEPCSPPGRWTASQSCSTAPRGLRLLHLVTSSATVAPCAALLANRADRPGTSGRGSRRAPPPRTRAACSSGPNRRAWSGTNPSGCAVTPTAR